MTFTDFIVGPGQYDKTQSSGAPPVVIPVTAGILIGSQMLAAALFALLGVVDSGLAPITYGTPPQRPPQGSWFFMAFALLSQALIVGLVLLAAFKPGIRPALKLLRPAGGGRAYVFAMLAMVPLIAAFNGVLYLLAPDMMASDFRVFRDLARSDHLALTALVIGVGAPLSEELLFRGYLLSSLATLPLGFATSAVLATTGWALLHLNYSIAGLIEVFLIGIYFSWLLWRTGSLLPALVCHAVYNSCLLAFLRFAPV